MLFNAMVVALAAVRIERDQGWRSLIGLYLIGGLAGQMASVIAYPNLVSSGASQAMLALCGAVLASPRPRGRAALIWGMVMLATAVQFGLDLEAAGFPKAGHVTAFVIGLAYGRWRPLRTADHKDLKASNADDNGPVDKGPVKASTS